MVSATSCVSSRPVENRSRPPFRPCPSRSRAVPRPGHAQRAGRALLTALAALGLTATATTGYADEAPFETVELRVIGRPVQVWPVELTGKCGPNTSDILVISVSGGPPDESRVVTIFPCGRGVDDGAPAPIRVDVPADAMALDVCDVDERPGGELVWLDHRGLTLVRPFGDAPPRTIAIEGGLPLPPRQRQVSRMPIVNDWDNDGRAKALVPTTSGGVIVDLATGESRPIEMPLVAQYDTWDPDLPARVRKLLIAMLHWPVLMRGDDDGDGRTDLFALTRWEIAIYHERGEGLPSEPSRRIPLRPFDEEAELRFESTDVTYFATDVNGDDLTDLMLHRISGGFNNGLSETDFFFNARNASGQAGIDADREPDKQLRLEKGFSGIEPMDLDGDGRVELIESSVQFGIMQMVRVLLTRKAEIKVRVLTAADGGKLRESWSEDMVFKLNFGEGRVDGLMPTTEGDWNGDGRRDALYQHSGDKLGVRLGKATDKGPGFTGKIAEQPSKVSAGFLRVSDLDGDGLDDFVSYDPRDAAGRLYVSYNRGVLPGTTPRMVPAE